MGYKKNLHSNMREAIAYARVSSKKQVSEGHGLESQIANITAYAHHKGIEIIKTFQEKGISGSFDTRPELERLYTFAREYQDANIDTGEKLIVMFYDVSRLARDTMGYHKIKSKLEKELGCEIQYITQKFDNTSSGKFVESIHVAFAEMERHKNAERTVDKMAARVKAGYWVYGSVPMGYKPSEIKGLKEPIPYTSKVIKNAMEAYAAGQFKTYTALAHYLNEAEIPDYRGVILKFDGERAKNLLGWSWFHAGFVKCDKNSIPLTKAKHKAIISFDTHELIEKRLRGQKISPYRKNSAHFPLRGDVICSSCNKPMSASFCGGYGYYFCKVSGCDQKDKHIKYKSLHQKFVELIARVVPSQDMIANIKGIFDKVWNDEILSFGQQKNKWVREISFLENRIQSCMDEIFDENDSVVKQRLRDRLAEMAERQELLKLRVEASARLKSDEPIILDRVVTLLSRPAEIWNKSDVQTKKVVQGIIFPCGLIYDHSIESFRKPDEPLLFTFIKESGANIPQMARPRGFEPLTS